MTDTEITAGEQRVLTMYRQAPDYAKPIMVRAMAWLQMGVPRAKVEALWRRAQALARLPLRPEARRPRPNQEGAAAPGRHRARDRAPQVRRPSRPQLPQRTPRRSRQRRPHRHRPQPPPRPQVAEETLVQIHHCSDRRPRASLRAQNRFLTDDYVTTPFSGIAGQQNRHLSHALLLLHRDLGLVLPAIKRVARFAADGVETHNPAQSNRHCTRPA